MQSIIQINVESDGSKKQILATTSVKLIYYFITTMSQYLIDNWRDFSHRQQPLKLWDWEVGHSNTLHFSRRLQSFHLLKCTYIEHCVTIKNLFMGLTDLRSLSLPSTHPHSQSLLWEPFHPSLERAHHQRPVITSHQVILFDEQDRKSVV